MDKRDFLKASFGFGLSLAFCCGFSGEALAKGVQFRLDQIELPPAYDNRKWRNFISKTALREAKAFNWGAEKDAKIEFRVSVETIEERHEADIVSYNCALKVVLPRNKRARSRLEYSGKWSSREKILKETLRIALRGALSRAAELEKKRRADLEPSKT